MIEPLSTLSVPPPRTAPAVRRNPWVLFALAADVALVLGVLRIQRQIEVAPKSVTARQPYGALQSVATLSDRVIFFYPSGTRVVSLRADLTLPGASMQVNSSPVIWRATTADSESSGRGRFWTDLSRPAVQTVRASRVVTLEGSAVLGDSTVRWSSGGVTLTARSGALVSRPWVEYNAQRMYTDTDFRLHEAVLAEVNGEQNIVDSRGARLRMANGRVVNARVSIATTLGSLWGFEVLVPGFLTLLGSHLALLASARTQHENDRPFVQKFFRWCGLLGAFLVGAIALAVWKV